MFVGEGMNEPSVYMHFCGLNLSGWILCSSIGRECVVWLDSGWLYWGGLTPCLGVFFLSMGGSLGWVMFDLYIIEFKYVGCDCGGSLGVIRGRPMFVDFYYGGVLIY